MPGAYQGDGLGPAGEGDGSVLEDYMDSLLVMPVEVRRNITLLRELDEKSHAELANVRAEQARLIEEARKRTEGITSSSERARTIRQLRAEPDFVQLEELRKDLLQKIAEKRSVAEQLHDMSEQNLKRLNGDIKYLEELFRRTGEIPDLGFAVDREVAAWMEQDQVWILARISEFSTNSPNRVVVADAEDSSARFTLTSDQVTVLPDKETLSAARTRLPVVGLKVLAIYPDTTSFYQGTLTGLAVKESSTTGAGSRGGASSGHAPGTILCQVEFDDDEDKRTGKTPKHNIPSKHVFAVSANAAAAAQEI
mmetsp:Transcript_15201/g.48398  ORF Transcript_15201/g.48398 Transcript_15201/m.48398 type:complete len:309 (-) Transcript_15201:1234-2160(-)